MAFPMGFQPFPKNPQTKWLDLHDLSVGPAILAVRWWLAEAPWVSPWGISTMEKKLVHGASMGFYGGLWWFMVV